MPRKKAVNQQELYTCSIRTRVTQTTFERLEKIRKESDCASIGEIARKVLSNEKINCFYRDVSLNAPMEEMALIRKELKAIGININQQTRHFHTSEKEAQKAFYILKTTELYTKVGTKVEELLIIISQLADKWLPKS
ncbi:MAG: mobilization protein [Pedobacter sp.]